MINRIQRRIIDRLRSILLPEVNDLRLRIAQSSIIAAKTNRPTYKYLWDAEVKVFSQWGEDGILEYLCDILGISKPKVVELGAGNFRECNSRYLAENRNASVVAVDGRSDLVASVMSQGTYWKNHLFPLQKWITPDSVGEIMEFAINRIGDVEVISLDIDGNDYWVMEKINLEKIKIIVVEYNPLFGDRRAVSVAANPAFDRSKEHFSWLYYGASLGAWIHLFSKSDFSFIGTNRVGSNAFFIKSIETSKLHFDLPTDYSIFVDWRIREARNSEGKLSYVSGEERFELIKELSVVDVISGEVLKLSAT